VGLLSIGIGRKGMGGGRHLGIFTSTKIIKKLAELYLAWRMIRKKGMSSNANTNRELRKTLLYTAEQGYLTPLLIILGEIEKGNVSPGFEPEELQQTIKEVFWTACLKGHLAITGYFVLSRKSYPYLFADKELFHLYLRHSHRGLEFVVWGSKQQIRKDNFQCQCDLLLKTFPEMSEGFVYKTFTLEEFLACDAEEDSYAEDGVEELLDGHLVISVAQLPADTQSDLLSLQ
jgi:hypothetical protein